MSYCCLTFTTNQIRRVTLPFFLSLIITTNFYGQENLVQNGSFEEYHTCPEGEAYFEGDQLIGCKYWKMPGSGTSDYFNSCHAPSNEVGVPDNFAGWQVPFQGNAYAGIIIYADPEGNQLTVSEYIQTKLIRALESCEKYQVRFWVNLSNCSARASNTIGLRFDSVEIVAIETTNENIIKLPDHINTTEIFTDTSDWHLITGVYEALGGEEYITIGRFWDTTAYSMTNVPNISISHDTCLMMSYYDEAYYYIDSVSVTHQLISEPTVTIPNIITPNSDGLNETWYPITNCFVNWTCEIFNRWGNQVYKFTDSDTGWSGLSHDGKELVNGVYYYRIYNDKELKTGFIQLIR